MKELNKTASGCWLVFSILFFLIVVGSIQLPKVEHLGLDPSWKAALQYAQSIGMAQGKDIVFTSGPLGFLSAAQSVYAGFRHFALMGFACGLLRGVALASLCLLFTSRVPFVLRVVVLSSVVFLQGTEPDAARYFILFGAGIRLLNSESRTFKEVLGSVFFVFVGTGIALVKFTFFFLWGFIFIAIILFRLRRRGYGVAAMWGFVACVTLLGSMAATNTWDLMLYLLNSWAVAAGYSGAMMRVSTSGVLVCGLWVLGSLVVIGILRFCRGNDRGVAAMEVLLFMATTFMAWKGGYTRADGHVLIFLCFGILCLTYLGWTATLGPSRSAFPAMFLAAMLATGCLGGLHFGRFCPSARDAWMLVRAPFDKILWLSSLSLHLDELEQKWCSIKNGQPSDIRNVLGNDLVDVFGYEEGVAIENALNYLPRPTIQSYTAYNFQTQQIGLRAHLERPRKILFALHSLDDRLASLEDALLFRHILWSMHMERTVGSYLLFEPGCVSDGKIFQLHFCDGGRVSFGQWVEVETDSGHALFLQAKFDETLLGRIAEFVFKKGRVYLYVDVGEGDPLRFRYPVAAGMTGALIDPLLITTSDVRALVETGDGRRILRFRFGSKTQFVPPFGFGSSISIGFASVPFPDHVKFIPNPDCRRQVSCVAESQ
jgi:hypothetical protein